MSTILLTGASGVVGSAVRPLLGRHRVICLTHRNPVAGESLRGDLTRRRLGLDPAAHRRLAAEVDAVLHCAAVTDFAAGDEATRDLNVAGTRRILDFTAAADARLLYVSTAFVARTELTRRARGGDTRDAAASPDEYLDSKRAAEQLVRDSGLRAAVARPSVVIGDSATGAISRFQGLHGIAGALLKGVLPLVPLDPASRIDAVPQDLVAAALAALVDAEVEGGEYWLTAGPQALTAGRMVELCEQTADRLGLDITRPRLVPAAMVDRLIRPVFIDPLPQRERRKFDDLLAMAALFDGATPFPTSLGRIPGGPAQLSAAAWEDAFVASLVYLAQAKGLLPEPVGVAA